MLRTNSGESSIERWVRKRARQGTTARLDAVTALIDMMRVNCKRQVAGEVAMTECSNYYSYITISCSECKLKIAREVCAMSNFN